MAAQAVFGTYELLEQVLLHLPPTELTRVMRVARSWKDIIEGSSTLHDHRIVLPYPPTDVSISSAFEDQGVPEYSQYCGLTPSSAFEVSKISWTDAGRARINIDLNPQARDWLAHRAHEFATFPPCQRICLGLCYYAVKCTVSAKNGVRIGDILDVSRALVRTCELIAAEDWDFWPYDITTVHLIGCEVEGGWFESDLPDDAESSEEWLKIHEAAELEFTKAKMEAISRDPSGKEVAEAEPMWEGEFGKQQSETEASGEEKLGEE